MLPVVYLSAIADENYTEEFERLYDKYHLVLMDDAYRIIKDYDYAQDIVQESFLRVARNMGRIDFSSRPLQLLRTINRNCAFDLYARLKRENNLMEYEESDSVADEKDFVSDLESRSDAEMIALFVEKMAPGYGEVFILRYMHDLSCVQIAGLLDMKAATVRKRLERIRSAVAEKLYGERSGENGQR